MVFESPSRRCQGGCLNLTQTEGVKTTKILRTSYKYGDIREKSEGARAQSRAAAEDARRRAEAAEAKCETLAAEAKRQAAAVAKLEAAAGEGDKGGTIHT